MDKQEALAVSFANLGKSAKQKDLLQTAIALSYLRSLPEYGSNDKVAAAVGFSREIVREFLTILKLPPDIQKLFEPGGLKLEHARRLWQLSRRRPGILHESADAMSDMGAIDARHLVDHLLRFPQMSVAEAKQAIIAAKTIKEVEYHVIAILSEDQYSCLQAAARARRMSVDQLVSSIVGQWLSHRQA